LGAIGIALLSIKNMRRSGLEAQSIGGTSVAIERNQDDLSDYLAQVDRDLGMSSDTNLSLNADSNSDVLKDSNETGISEKANS
jgi:hypothetical protein